MHDITVTTPRGTFAGIDFGGPARGCDVLLIHDVMTNAAQFYELGERLSACCRPIAVDQRGHGYSVLPAEADDPTTAIADLAAIGAALPQHDPIVVAVGRSCWKVAAAVRSGMLRAGGLVLVDPDRLYLRQWRSSERDVLLDDHIENLTSRYALGADIAPRDRRAFVGAQADVTALDLAAREMPTWIVHAIIDRSLVPVDGRLVRLPAPDGLKSLLRFAPLDADGTGPDAFSGIDVPIWFANADHGLYGQDSPISSILGAHRNRRELRFPGVGGIVEVYPAHLTEFIRALATALTTGVDQPELQLALA